jgi:hypothetical protein
MQRPCRQWPVYFLRHHDRLPTQAVRLRTGDSRFDSPADTGMSISRYPVFKFQQNIFNMEQPNEKLVRVRTHMLVNELYYRFHTENGELYTRYGVDQLGIAAFITPFRAGLADLDKALERIDKSADTERAAAADREFDISFSGLREYARSCLHHFDPAARRAAENLDVVFGHYGNIGREAYRQELASSYNLIQDLRARKDDVATLNLEPWIQAHEQAAAALTAILDARTGETAQQTELRVKQVRRTLDAVYQQIVDRIDAMINISGRDFVPGFVAEYNAHASEYKNKLARHLGRIRAKNSDRQPSGNNAQ